MSETAPEPTMPYPDDPGATHFPACWLVAGHHNCAVRIVHALSAQLAAARSEAKGNLDA